MEPLNRRVDELVSQPRYKAPSKGEALKVPVQVATEAAAPEGFMYRVVFVGSTAIATKVHTPSGSVSPLAKLDEALVPESHWKRRSFDGPTIMPEVSDPRE